MPKVKVRIAVAVDEKGRWNSCGGDNMDAGTASDFAREPIGDSRIYWLTAEVEVPESVEVTADVEGGE